MRHRISYPAEMSPGDFDNIYWIIKDPDDKYRKIPMHENALTVVTSRNGVYRVSVEFWNQAKKKEKKLLISNFVEFEVRDSEAPAR